MTNQELKAALLDGSNVVYTRSDGISFEATVSGIMYRRAPDKESITIEAELTPTNGANSITFADPKRVERVKTDEKSKISMS